jgi:hypothetical protein
MRCSRAPPPVTGAKPGGVEAYPGARNLPWSEDWQAQAIVEERGALTLQEVAEIMGCTRERIRQIELQAMGKLRRHLRNKGAAADLIAFLRERLCHDDDETSGRPDVRRYA